ncbi:hypothetical protein DK37_02415 [Halomonas sp. SUBG004]|nr:hypothetical protein DK37_02415 [Halomonas sp. SUBG004]
MGARYAAGMGAASAMKSATVRRDTANAITPPAKRPKPPRAAAVQRTAAVSRWAATATQTPTLFTPLAVACTFRATAVARYPMEAPA